MLGRDGCKIEWIVISIACQFFRSTMIGLAPHATAAFTSTPPFSITAAPLASCIWPKTCSLRFFNFPDSSVSLRTRHPACLPLRVLSRMRYGGVWVKRISVVLGIKLYTPEKNYEDVSLTDRKKTYLLLQHQSCTEKHLERTVGRPAENHTPFQSITELTYRWAINFPSFAFWGGKFVCFVFQIVNALLYQLFVHDYSFGLFMFPLFDRHSFWGLWIAFTPFSI
jgi:hypothetical protein